MGPGLWMKEKTPMKKKLLSLALLPTAALAVAHDTDSHTNLTYDNKTATQHTKHCATEDCEMAPVVENHTWGTNDKVGTCTDCDYVCQHPVDSGYAYTTAHACKTCGKTHDEGTDHSYTDKNDANPSGKCAICGAACPHTGETAKQACSKCGKIVPADPVEITEINAGPDAPFTTGGAVSFIITTKPAEAASALEVKTITWTPKGTESVDTSGTKEKAPSKAGLYTVAFTVGLTDAAKDLYTIKSGIKTDFSVGDVEVNAPSTQTPTTPETPKEEEKAPSTNSQGVPVASEVTTVKQANQAIDTLKKTNADTMADKLMTNDTAASSFASLDRTVASVKGIDTGVERKTGLPSVVNSGTVGVVGAALNASGSTVRLVVDVPSKAYTASAGYQVSMTMTGVSNAAKLAVPVIITLPLPSDVQAGRVVVLHYHSGSTPTVIIPSVSGNTLRFAVTGFSDFVITDYGDVEANGGSGYYTVVQGGANRVDPNALDNATLAAIASLASGDVFTDVPATHWAADQIRWARNQNLMGGYEDGSFHPTAATTRQQLWMVLARMDGTFPATMADARAWAVNTGVSDGTNPAGVLSRQQLVTMLYRFA